jgi:hypothetical protein
LYKNVKYEYENNLHLSFHWVYTVVNPIAFIYKTCSDETHLVTVLCEGLMLLKMGSVGTEAGISLTHQQMNVLPR